MLPVSVNNDDVQKLMDSVLTGVKDAVVFDTFIVHKSLIQKLRSSFSTLMREKATKVCIMFSYIIYIRNIKDMIDGNMLWH